MNLTKLCFVFGAISLVTGCTSSVNSTPPGATAGCTASTTAICGKFTPFKVSAELPWGIAAGPRVQGTVWFTNPTRGDASSVVEFMPPSSSTKDYRTLTRGARPDAITRGMKHLWFTETEANKIGVIDPFTGKQHDYTIPTRNSQARGIAEGPHSDVYFTEALGNRIGRVSADGHVFEYAPFEKIKSPYGIIAGADGALYFAENQAGAIGRMTPAGQYREYPAAGLSVTGGIAEGPDKNVWFTAKDAVGRLDSNGAVKKFPVPKGIFHTPAIVSAMQGVVLVGVFKMDRIGAVIGVKPDGTTSEYDLPVKNLMPISMTQTADGAIWLTVASLHEDVSRSVIYRLQ